MNGAILFVFCGTCYLGTGALWPPFQFDDMAGCLRALEGLSTTNTAELLAMPDGTPAEAIAKIMAIREMGARDKLEVRCISK